MKKTYKTHKKYKRYKRYKKYFVTSEHGLSIADNSFFDSIRSWNEALSVGVSCYLCLQKTLVEDAVDGEVSFIGNMKVTTGLERSLEELNQRHPNLLENIHSMPLMINGSRVFRA